MSRRQTCALLISLSFAAAADAEDGDAAAQGFSWYGGITSAAQYAHEFEPEYSLSADLFLTHEGTRGTWLVYVEGSSAPQAGSISAVYPTANGDAGSVINQDGDGGVQISEFNYTLSMTGGTSVMVGLIDPSAWLDRSRITNDENTHFLNGNFVNNATIDFPDYTLGSVIRWGQTDLRPELTLVVASSDGIADLPDRSYQDLLNLTSAGRGAFIGLGAGWLREKTSMRLGAWARTDDHAVAGQLGDTEKNYGAYTVFGWQDAPNAVNLRLGFANDDVSVASRFIAAAYQRQTSRGLFGIGYAYTRTSDEFRLASLADLHDAEVFFRIPIGADRGHITPSVQYVENPGFRASGEVAPRSSVVAGVRLHLSF